MLMTQSPGSDNICRFSSDEGSPLLRMRYKKAKVLTPNKRNIVVHETDCVPFGVGERIQVWSESGMVWIPDAIVAAVAKGHSRLLPAGAIKATYTSGRSKWIVPERFGVDVKRWR